MMEHAFDRYHKALLQALRQHRRKFRRVPAQPLVRERGALLDRRQFFELRLRNILERNIDDADIQLLPFQKAQDLRHKLDDLFNLLNGIANQNLGTITCDPASQCICKPGGHHLRLENLLSILFHSDGQFDLSGGTDSAIFIITELQCGKRAASLVRDVKDILDSIHLRIHKKRPVDEQSSCTNDIDNWLRSFGHKYPQFLGKILDTIRTEFGACDDLSGCDMPHKVLIRLLDLALPNPSSSETILDIFLFCPRPTTKTWQNTRCKIDREIDVGSDQTKKLCEYLEDSVRFREGLTLLFDETLAAYTQGFDAFDLPIKDQTTHPFQSLNDLMELFNLPTADSSKRALLFKHSERRALAAKLALHFLICCSWENTPETWDSSTIYFLGSSTQDFKRDSPYISCLEGNEATDSSQAANGPIQCFTAFAKLLLEIEYGPMPIGNFSAAKDWTAIRDYHREWLEQGDLSRERYLNAVGNCLQFHRRYRRDRLSSIGRSESPKETRQRLVRTDVVRNLVADLPGFQQLVIKRPKTASSSAQEDPQVSNPGFDFDSGVFDEQFPRFVREPSSPELKETQNMEIGTRAPLRKGAQKVSFAGSLCDFENVPQRPATADSAEERFRMLDNNSNFFGFPFKDQAGAESLTPNRDRPSRREGFQIAIICALPLEYDAVSLLFDQFWDEDGEQYGRAPGDTNTYTTGRIGKYDVVLALLPNMGKAATAGAAASVRSSYSGLKLAFLVGLCGGVPGAGADEALLGDVVISKTVVQHDLGRQFPNAFVTKNTVNDNPGRPNKDIRGLIASFETELGRERLQQKASEYLKDLQSAAAHKRRRCNYRYPGAAEDKLFAPAYRHRHRAPQSCAVCDGETDDFCEEAAKASCAELNCDEDQLVARERLGTDGMQYPEIFIGHMASGDTVMKSGEHRDRIAQLQNVIAFEMEGAGAWDEVPCIIVKGICDYADSHKNKLWQAFAAATAASVMKAVLGRYARTDSPGPQHEALVSVSASSRLSAKQRLSN
ncbi:purine and uridine phosphorylase [Lentithecium fluviatile CBS 122367]|uniref:Purine and uridine phosphorylase n=1 Tax=Lentithecium fluviatile CBS 122367 TaxID=1168545 RepID=A0A6G1JMW6_9PLEO|nr:purine and uridine phosphorylase [Lentithecium fluviatile CBS 122367]